MARKNGGGPTERAIEALLTVQAAQAKTIEGILSVQTAQAKSVEALLSVQTAQATSIDGIRGDITEMRGDITEMRGDIGDMRAGLLDVRNDIRTLTRVMVRRFGTSGSPEPIVGDHVLFRSRDGVWRPAVVLAVHSSNELDLEVFGMRDGDDRRYPSAASAGEEPGCWRVPG